MSEEVEQLRFELAQVRERLEQTVRELDRVAKARYNQDDISYIQDRLRLRTANYLPGTITASRLALDSRVATVTAVNGYTPLYDAGGNLLKVATLT